METHGNRLHGRYCHFVVAHSLSHHCGPLISRRQKEQRAQAQTKFINIWKAEGDWHMLGSYRGHIDADTHLLDVHLLAIITHAIRGPWGGAHGVGGGCREVSGVVGVLG